MAFRGPALWMFVAFLALQNSNAQDEGTTTTTTTTTGTTTTTTNTPTGIRSTLPATSPGSSTTAKAVTTTAFPPFQDMANPSLATIALFTAAAAFIILAVVIIVCCVRRNRTNGDINATNGSSSGSKGQDNTSPNNGNGTGNEAVPTIVSTVEKSVVNVPGPDRVLLNQPSLPAPTVSYVPPAATYQANYGNGNSLLYPRL